MTADLAMLDGPMVSRCEQLQSCKVGWPPQPYRYAARYEPHYRHMNNCWSSYEAFLANYWWMIHNYSFCWLIYESFSNNWLRKKYRGFFAEQVLIVRHTWPLMNLSFSQLSASDPCCVVLNATSFFVEHLGMCQNRGPSKRLVFLLRSLGTLFWHKPIWN